MMHDMKQALFFVVLLAVLGIAGFLYRNTLEAPTRNTNVALPGACAADAKICPDGTSVARSGPSCAFAACTAPNVEIPSARISFVLPTGYEASRVQGTDTSLIATYAQRAIAASSSQPSTIVIRRFPIPAGKDANSVMLAQTMYESSGMQPASMQEFTPIIVNGVTYQMIVVERFEALVHVEYYLPRGDDVLRFEALQHDVTDWTNSGLNVRTLPAVATLEMILGTLQSTSTNS